MWEKQQPFKEMDNEIKTTRRHKVQLKCCAFNKEMPRGAVLLSAVKWLLTHFQKQVTWLVWRKLDLYWFEQWFEQFYSFCHWNSSDCGLKRKKNVFFHKRITAIWFKVLPFSGAKKHLDSWHIFEKEFMWPALLHWHGVKERYRVA